MVPLRQSEGADPNLADSTFYIVNDHRGESGFQWHITRIVAELIQFYFECLPRTMLVSGNQFIHFQKGDPKANIAPDLYVIADDETPVHEVRSWKLWEHGGKAPTLALEVVSDDPEEAQKDYDAETLAKYERMGLGELFRYDPYCGSPQRRLGGRSGTTDPLRRNEEGRLLERPPGIPTGPRARILTSGWSTPRLAASAWAPARRA